jgi:uncharacterized protein YbjQ (UPF0145 family)
VSLSTTKEIIMFHFKKSFILATVLGMSVTAVQARDTTLNLDFKQAVDKAVQAGTIDGSVKFYLDGTTPSGATIVQSDVVTNTKTNAFNKTDEGACDWAFRSALIQLQKAAKAQGANAVVDVVSFYKRNETKSTTTYECHAGTMIAGVALKAKLAKL